MMILAGFKCVVLWLFSTEIEWSPMTHVWLRVEKKKHLLRGLGGQIPMNTYAYNIYNICIYIYYIVYYIYICMILYQHISTAPATFEKGLGRRWYLPHWWVRQDVSWRDSCEGRTETMTDMHPTQMNQGYYKYRQIPVQVPHHLIIRQFPWLTCSIVE